MNRPCVHIIGAGLAGSEAAYFLAEHGVTVYLHEMRPQRMTAAHQTADCAELVCSNSFKSTSPISAPGMLKAEMNQWGSLILKIAQECAIPAGEALAVNRVLFSRKITQTLRNHPHIHWEPGEVLKPFANSINLFATGPLTSDLLSQWLTQITGAQNLYFYDAIAPIVDAQSIDLNIVFQLNRYNKGGQAAYLNCPMTQAEYQTFLQKLIQAPKVPPQAFEKEIFFQGCQPIESIAQTGEQSLRFGPMKPIGLMDPRTQQLPYAVVQLRAENLENTAYNLVGFQTKLKYAAQKEIFRLIPGLKNAEFFRLGSVHRNTYLCTPSVLRGDLSLKHWPQVYFAGQMTGVEGYLESTATGLLAAHFILQRIRNQKHSAPPANTAMGALLRHLTQEPSQPYTPSNIHFGLFNPLFFENINLQHKTEARKAMATQALQASEFWLKLQQFVDL